MVLLGIWDWLERLESAKGMRRRQLLPVSAEVCFAHARLGMATALNRWLTWFTDPSDPAALDPVQAALGGWQLRRGQVEAAIQHAMAIQRPTVRDGFLVRIIDSCRETDPERGGDCSWGWRTQSWRGSRRLCP